MLEARLDIVVYRLNFARTIFAARQMVSHRHIQVNGETCNIPSRQLKEGDTITIKGKPGDANFQKIVEFVKSPRNKTPEYLAVNESNLEGKFIRPASVEEVPYPFNPSINLIVEYYSK